MDICVWVKREKYEGVYACRAVSRKRKLDMPDVYDVVGPLPTTCPLLALTLRVKPGHDKRYYLVRILGIVKRDFTRKNLEQCLTHAQAQAMRLTAKTFAEATAATTWSPDTYDRIQALLADYFAYDAKEAMFALSTVVPLAVLRDMDSATCASALALARTHPWYLYFEATQLDRLHLPRAFTCSRELLDAWCAMPTVHGVIHDAVRQGMDLYERELSGLGTASLKPSAGLSWLMAHDLVHVPLAHVPVCRRDALAHATTMAEFLTSHTVHVYQSHVTAETLADLEATHGCLHGVAATPCEASFLNRLGMPSTTLADGCPDTPVLWADVHMMNVRALAGWAQRHRGMTSPVVIVGQPDEGVFRDLCGYYADEVVVHARPIFLPLPKPTLVENVRHVKAVEHMDHIPMVVVTSAACRREAQKMLGLEYGIYRSGDLARLSDGTCRRIVRVYQKNAGGTRKDSAKFAFAASRKTLRTVPAFQQPGYEKYTRNTCWVLLEGQDKARQFHKSGIVAHGGVVDVSQVRGSHAAIVVYGSRVSPRDVATLRRHAAHVYGAAVPAAGPPPSRDYGLLHACLKRV